MSDYSHLIPEAADVLQLSTDKKIEFVLDDFWVGYPRANQILNALEDLLMHPKTLRMPNLLLVGDSGNGKSTIVEHFWKKHQSFVESEGTNHIPVVFAEMPSEPSESRFWTAVLDAMFLAHRPTDHVQRKEAQAVSVMRTCNVRMLIVDEIHNLLFGHARQQRHFLGVLKNLSNKLKIPIVAVGTREAIRALHTDPQLSSRFEPMGLQRWALNREFLSLLASYEQLMPLPQASCLASKELAVKIHSMSGGTIGGVTGVIKKATVHALRNDKEKIDLECLNSIEWVRLSDYHRQADAL